MRNEEVDLEYAYGTIDDGGYLRKDGFRQCPWLYDEKRGVGGVGKLQRGSVGGGGGGGCGRVGLCGCRCGV